MSKLNRNFSLNQCTYTFTAAKKSTARQVLKKLYPDCLVYTFEASFHGSDLNHHLREFTELDYLQLGKDLMLSIYLLYRDEDSDTFQHKEKESYFNDSIKTQIKEWYCEMVDT